MSSLTMLQIYLGFEAKIQAICSYAQHNSENVRGLCHYHSALVGV